MKSKDKLSDREFLDEKIIDTRMRSFAKLFLILVETFGQQKTIQNIGKREGQQIQIYFRVYDKYLTFTLSKTQMNINVGPSENAVATINFKIEADQIQLVISDLIRTKGNLKGLLKIVFKYVLPNKIRFKGSIGAALRLSLLIMVGKHPMYKKGKVVPLVLNE